MKKRQEICAQDKGYESASFKTLFLIGSVGALFTLGLVIIFSATSAEVLDQNLSKSIYYAVGRQLLYAFCGVFLAAMIVLIDYRLLLKNAPVLFFLCTLLLILTLVPGIGREANGSRRWLSFFGLSFQPSELAKYIAPLFFIQQIILCKKQITFKKFIKIASLSALPLPLIALEPNNGSSAVIGSVLLVLCIITQIPLRYWLFPLLIGAVICGAFAMHHPYVAARVKAYLNPTQDLKGKGHQPYQAKIAAGSGRLWGKGVGNSWQKLSYLPEAQNDYIAAIYGEEFGFVGITCLLILYSCLIFTAFATALHSSSEEGYYLASSIAFLLGIQVFLNLGVVSGLLPSTGLNLPYFSQGGSSLIANLCGLGFLISINKVSKEQKTSPLF